jgi:hypothetical protein
MFELPASHDRTSGSSIMASFGAARAVTPTALVASFVSLFVLVVLRVYNQYHFIGVFCLRHALIKVVRKQKRQQEAGSEKLGK